MDAERNNSNGRLERMLREWGAEQAARQAPAPPAVAAAPRRNVVAVIGRWAPLAAAAVLLIAAAGLYRASLRHDGHEMAESDQAPVLPLTREDTAPAPSQQADQARAAEKADAALADLLAELESAREALMTERQRSTDELAGLRQRLADADSEMARMRRMYDLERQERLRQASLVGQADSARARAQEMATAALPSADVATLYLAIAAPGQTGMSAVKAAAQARQLAGRCLALRERTEDEYGVRLLDRLEVVFTRLEMLDVTDDRAVAAFAALTRTGQMRELLAQAAGQPGNDDRRQFLLEVRLIFQAVDDVA